jgi:hypothetical protein
MLSLSRHLLAGLVIAGLAAFATGVSAQDKKDPKKDAPKKDAPPAKKDDKAPPKPDDPDKSVAFGTSDGLSLKGYWYQGQGLEKQRPDAVMMFPAPGTKVTDAWIDLAKEMSKKNFSVLLFDWRGCGMNGPDAGARIFDNNQAFWYETYNAKLLSGRKKAIEDKGLDYKYISTRSEGSLKYSDFMLNDLTGARFYLDRMNDNQKCNTNRVWIVSEKDGAQLGLAFIATEFHRNTVYSPNPTPGQGIQVRPAGKDYVGLVALSYANGSDSARTIFRNAMPAAVAGVMKEARDHLETRLATDLIYSKKEGASSSKNLINQLGASGTEEQMKKNFKYLREIDVKDKPISGIGMIDTMDSFAVRKTIMDDMVGISKAQPFNKDSTDRQANKMLTIPRFQVEGFNRR